MSFLSRTQRITSIAALSLALALAGCSTQTAGTGTASTVSAANSSSSSSSTDANLAASIAEDTHFDDDDLTWTAADETQVTLTGTTGSTSGTNADAVTVDGGTVTINAAGTYRLTGELTGQIVVAAGEEDMVRIILDGADITSTTGSALVISSANEALVYLEDGTTNTLTDASTYSDTGEDAPSAALYSMADLTIAGSGALNVSGNFADGIVSKDGLVLASGTVTVDAVDDGIKGKDYTVLLDGVYDVTAGGDGVKSNNEEEEGRGWLLVTGGTLNVAAGDDGVKAFNNLTVSGGTVTVSESEEGLEAAHITVSGGNVSVTANDDGVNASGGASTTASTTGGMGGGGMGGGGGEQVGDYSVNVTGGTLTIDSDGDGLDSNGNASISGGTVVVNGPTGDGNGALDVNGELSVTGGTLAAAGSAGMAVTPGDTSTQSGVQLTFATVIPAGTAIQIADASGTVVASFITAKTTASLVLSNPAITEGGEYSIYTGGNVDVEAGLGTGTLDGATKLGTVTAGEYTAARGPGGGR